MTNYSVLMPKPQLKTKSTTDPYLLIVAEDCIDANLIIASLEKGKIVFNYQIVSSVNYLYSSLPCNYDAIIYYYRQDLEGKSPSEKLAWWLKSQPKVPIILVTTPLGDEQAVASLKAGISSYVLRHNLESLPKILLSLLQSFTEMKLQKQKLYEQDLLNTIFQARLNYPLLSDFLSNIADLFHEKFAVSQCLIYLIDNNYCFKYYAVSSETKDREKFQHLCAQISNQYSCCLQDNDYFIASCKQSKIPKQIQKIVKQNPNISPLLIIPIIYKQKYLGGICLNRSINQNYWQEYELILLKKVAEQCALILSIYLEEQSLWQRQQQLEKQAEKLLNLKEAKLELFSCVTHELRTPLTGILGFAKMLSEQIYGELNSRQMQYIQAILDSGEHLSTLINDLLDISKIDAAKEELFFERIAVEDVCLASISMVQELARQNNLELRLEIDEKISFCWADQRRLKQILINLLSNAIKFTEVGSVTLKVLPTGAMIKFAVIDTGIGISEADQQKLFQAFSQIKNHLHLKHKGTGRGLALSRKLARLHGGDLTLISTEGKGSCFTLHLPLNNK